MGPSLRCREMHRPCLSKPAARKAGGIHSFPRLLSLESPGTLPGSTKAAAGASVQEHPQPSPTHPSGFSRSQRNPLLSRAEPCLETQSLITCNHGLPLQQFHINPALERGAAKKKKKKVFFSFLICTHSILPKAHY